MGKRYFCDYCNRSFQDNLHNRKKHLNGVQHLRAKKVWYDLFRDSATILQEEQSKKPCREFLLSGRCDFGPNCRFSHMTEEDLEQLNAHVQEERRAKEQRQDKAVATPGTIDEWLEKRAKRLGTAQTDQSPLGGRVCFPVSTWLAFGPGSSTFPAGSASWWMAGPTQSPMGMTVLTQPGRPSKHQPVSLMPLLPVLRRKYNRNRKPGGLQMLNYSSHPPQTVAVLVGADWSWNLGAPPHPPHPSYRMYMYTLSAFLIIDCCSRSCKYNAENAKENQNEVDLI
nr:zinc finger matrin-type protein 5 isoform X1 [Zootoca vivipara]